MSDFLYIDQQTRAIVEKTSQANISKDLFENYRIDRSLRFNSADTPYLSRTPSTTTDRKTWTYSTWIKRVKLSSASQIFFGWNGTNTSTVFQFTSSDNLELYNYAGAYYAPRLITNQSLRDLSAWYHIILVWDADNATSSDRQRIYINGQRVTSFSTESYSNDIAYGINVASYPHGIGGGVGTDFDGYMAETNFIDGQALTPSSFGFFDNQRDFTWKPKKYSGTYGTNGFYLKFGDNSSTSTLGKDSSSNGNNWTPNNFSVTAGADNDSLVDSPTNYGTDTGVGGEVRGNYCTLNPLKNFGITLTNGNLDGASNTSTRASIYGTIGVSSGKWYWEVKQNSVSGVNALSIGIANKNGTITDGAGATSNEWIYYGQSGQKVTNNILTAYGASFTTGDIIGVAFNADAGTLVFYKNNTSQGTAFTGLTSGPYFPAIGDGGNSNAQSWTANFGQRPFAYTAPSGFKCLCTTNLSTPTIKKPSSYFDAVTYNGNTSTQTISGLGFSPDLVWLKSRSTSSTNHYLMDSVRGASQSLYSNSTAAEGSSGAILTSFNSNGFSLGADIEVNGVTRTYVAWAWDAGSSNATNNSGSITSTVRANPQTGFSIVGYTGNGTAGATVGHGLGTSPSMIITKKRSTATSSQWTVGFSALGWNKYILLNTTGAAATDSNVWNSAPTSSVFYLGTDIWNNQSGQTTIAYCFAEIEGYSKFDSYTGNGAADGPFVYCGFRPRWVMVKMSSSTGDWYIFDTARDSFNATQLGLIPNSSQADGTYTGWGDVTSNGFKIRRTDAAWNTSGGTYIFAAFAETPFKNARAR